MISSDSIRGQFLDFFASRDHLVLPGSSIVPDNDPSLLFINSGMAPMKRYFTGAARPPHPDLANYQACIRTKDIDDVGDRHHLTFFEMLGSWSIGHYFQERAIELAYELLVDGFGLSPDSLYATVFAGDARLNLPPDEVSAKAWESAGIPRSHIVALPAEDNFWGPAGETGPCGPCTEVFLDTGEAFGPAYVPGGDFDTSGRYIEIWNAGVFMQLDKAADGSFRPLPFTSVDTGSGLERMAMALNGLETVYDTDLLAPVVSAAAGGLGKDVRSAESRLVADHLRAAALMLSENVPLSNEGRGYVPRRLIRKCVTVALSSGREQLDFEPVVDAVVERLGAHYPRLVSEQSEIMAVLAAETRDFDRTVRRGLDRVETLLSKNGRLTGADAFQLFTTYGLPVEIAADLAAERGASVDLDGYQAEFEQHRLMSRGQTTHRSTAQVDLSGVPATAFLGYETTEAHGTVLALIQDGQIRDSVSEGEVQVVVDQTPFYAEGGGQVGDVGVISAGSCRLQVRSTRSTAASVFVHEATVESGSLAAGDDVHLVVDRRSRAATAANHTATHLLNSALRRVLGEGVTQAGSLVEPDRLRFDFRHPSPVGTAELAQIEQLVNEWVLDDLPRTVEVLPSDVALSSTAISLPGEDYGTEVRVLSYGEVSKELCGGTHAERTSALGSFRIVTEQSVAAGTRRIVAVTRERALELMRSERAALREAAGLLRSKPTDVPRAVQSLLERSDRARTASASTAVPVPVEDVRLTSAGVPFRIAQFDDAFAALRSEASRMAEELGGVAVLVAPAKASRVSVVVATAASVRDAVPADRLLTDLVGSGGGSAALAQGGAADSFSLSAVRTLIEGGAA